MSTPRLNPRQMFQLMNILRNLSGSQLNAYFSLLNDDDVLRRCASANVQSRATTLIKEAQARGRKPVLAIVKSLLQDSEPLRIPKRSVYELTQMELSLKKPPRGKVTEPLIRAPRENVSVPKQMELSPMKPARGKVAGPLIHFGHGDSAGTPSDLDFAAGPASAVSLGLSAGKQESEATSALKPLEPLTAPEPTSPTIRMPNSVFLVQGRNDKINTAMTSYLTSLGLTVFDWDEVLAMVVTEKGSGNPFIFDVIEKGMDMAAVVVVLITPDESASLREVAAPTAAAHELLPGVQPRPNVLIEAGMALGRDRSRTLLIQWGDSRALSDLSGMHLAKVAEDTQTRGRLRDRIIAMGVEVKPNQRWQTAGDFTV